MPTSLFLPSAISKFRLSVCRSVCRSVDRSVIRSVLPDFQSFQMRDEMIFTASFWEQSMQQPPQISRLQYCGWRWPTTTDDVVFMQEIKNGTNGRRDSYVCIFNFLQKGELCSTRIVSTGAKRQKRTLRTGNVEVRFSQATDGRWNNAIFRNVVTGLEHKYYSMDSAKKSFSSFSTPDYSFLFAK